MRATIHVNKFTAFTMLRGAGGYGPATETDVPRYVVDMVLQFSEQDRAAILVTHLDQVVFETVSLLTSDQILNELAKFDSEYESYSSTSTHGLTMRALMDQRRESYGSLADKTKEITLADYMAATGYSQIFNTLPEANDYSDKLKSAILPKIRTLLDKNASRETKQTLEF
jgi:hypothetical protein